MSRAQIHAALPAATLPISPACQAQAIGEPFPTYQYVDTAKEDGGKIYVKIANDGEVTFYEGLLSRKEIKARDQADAGNAGTPVKPEITKAMQDYLALHRHMAVRADVLKDSGVALRLIAAHMIAGSGLWKVSAEPQRCDRVATRQSLATSPCQQAFDAERREVTALLYIHEDDRPARSVVDIVHVLTGLSDEQVTRILAFAMAETLEADTALIEYLGQMLGTDPRKDWSPDDAFFDLLRDKQAINAMVTEAAGESAAKANLTATAKAQKGIIQEVLSGKRSSGNTNWTPRYMAFPMQAYTERGGIHAIEQADALPTNKGEADAQKAA